MAIKQIKSFISPRIKSLNAHPTQPLLLASLYTGDVQVWDTATMSLKKTISISQKPCRTAIFYEPLGYIIAGDDEGYITITDMPGNLVSKFLAHGDFVRRVVISSDMLLSCSDDCTIKSWCLRNFKLLNIFDGHTHFVMDITPELVSVSLDCTIKFWSQSGKLKKSISAHTSGVNCIAFISNTFITGSDDMSIKAWDPSPIKTISNAHTKNINRLVKLNREFASCSEDGHLKLWNFNFSLERSANLRNRVWDVVQKNGRLFVATDEALVVLEDRSEQVLVDMSKDKIYYTIGSTFYYHRIIIDRRPEVTPSAEGTAGDSLITSRTPLSAVKEVQLDYIPSSFSTSSSGKIISFIHNNSSFTIYSVLGFRSRLTGVAEDMVFLNDQEYITRSDKIYFHRKSDIIGEIEFKAAKLFLISDSDVGLDSADFSSLNRSLRREFCVVDDGVSCEISVSEAEKLHDVLEDIMSIPMLVIVGTLPGEESPLTLAIDLKGKVYFKAKLNPKLAFKIKRNLIFCTEKRLMVVGESIKFSRDQIIEEGTVDDNVFYFKSSGKLYYLLIPGIVGDGKAYKEPVLYPLGCFSGKIVGVRNSHLFYFSKNKIQVLNLDKSFILWQLSTISGVDVPIKSVSKSIKFLQLIGEYEKALGLSTDDNLKFEILLGLGRLEEALELANNQLKYQKLAKEFMKQRKYSKAAECFYVIKDVYNCYLVDFERRFKFNMDCSNLGFFVALEDKEYGKCAEMLKTTMFFNLFKKNYIK